MLLITMAFTVACILDCQQSLPCPNVYVFVFETNSTQFNYVENFYLLIALVDATVDFNFC